MTPPTLRAWSPERVSLGLGVAKEELSTLGALGSGSRRLSLVSGCRRRCQEEAARLAVCAISGAAGGRDGRGTATGGAGGRRGMPIWRCSPSVGSGCRGNRASVRAAVVLFDGGLAVCSWCFCNSEKVDDLGLAKAVIFGDRHGGITALETEAHDVGFMVYFFNDRKVDSRSL